MNLSIKLIILSCIFLFACNKQAYYYLQEEAKAWFNYDNFDERMTFMDENGITSELSLLRKEEYFDVGEGYFAIFKTETTHAEYRSFSYRHQVLGDVSLSVRALSDGLPDQFSIFTDKFYANFYLNTLEVINVVTYPNNGSIQSKDQYSGDKIETSVNIEEDFTINDKVYDQVMIIELEDFLSSYPLEGINKVIIAKDVGLIGLKVESGVFLYKNN